MNGSVVLTEIKCDASLSALRVLIKRSCGRHRTESLSCIYIEIHVHSTLAM